MLQNCHLSFDGYLREISNAILQKLNPCINKKKKNIEIVTVVSLIVYSGSWAAAFLSNTSQQYIITPGIQVATYIIF